MPIDIGISNAGPIDVVQLVVSLLIGAAISLIISWHFQKFGRTVSNRSSLGHVFPMIVLTTILVIAIVKSSLALSLGLVGALSIVRFRTPIKEPEELAYLFVSIAVGLGLGAGQTLATVVASVVIIGLLTARSLFRAKAAAPSILLNIESPLVKDTDAMLHTKVVQLLSESVQAADMRRLDMNGTVYEATFAIEAKDEMQIRDLLQKLSTALPDASVSFIDNSKPLAV